MTGETFSLGVAESFVQAHGAATDLAVWKAGFGWGPVEVLVFELEPHLDAAGVWADLVPDEAPGGLASTVAALRLLATVNLGEDIFEVGTRTLNQLQRRRSADGSWDAPGPWPGQGEGLPRRTWYTASLGNLVGSLTGSADLQQARQMREGAARWVQAHWARVADQGPAIWWAVLGCLADAPEPNARRIREDAAARLLRWLERPRPASDVAWIHSAAKQADQALLCQRACAALLASPREDGGWHGGSDAGWPVTSGLATYLAARVLVRP